ncbi:hypothetical protein MOO45_07565 [Bombilactobacillus folatiphilus]|uniref:PTS EIIC type-3 domain-containing protein n=1 Tax=Bombilactobacillus folatiphilus TaxID=2923362 RepID=A0ABY4P8Q9_9LACO|nr:hypothetical protein [Bombilactobacillus folatiphilus]UQS82037.1 hypothetical protein MOO45_07565 [Bombilactobacillus folatiphilus]
MFDFRPKQLLSRWQHVLWPIYPFVLFDAYLHVIIDSIIMPHGFLTSILHLPNLKQYLPWFINMHTILESCILLFLGYNIANKFSNTKKQVSNFCAILIIIITSFTHDVTFTFHQQPLLLVIVIGLVTALIINKIPYSSLQIFTSLGLGYLFNWINQLNWFNNIPGISTNAQRIQPLALIPLNILRCLGTWLGLINPFNAKSQAITSPSAVDNLSSALSHKNLNNLPYPINTHSLYSSYAFLGGVGCTLGLIFALLICKQHQVVLENLIPSMFGLNAPLFFKLPILLNPILLVPFILSPIISMLIGFIFITMHWTPPAVYQIFAGTPSFLLNFLGTNGHWGAFVATLLAIISSTLIYLPFIKYEVRHEKQILD